MNLAQKIIKGVMKEFNLSKYNAKMLIRYKIGEAQKLDNSNFYKGGYIKDVAQQLHKALKNENS